MLMEAGKAFLMDSSWHKKHAEHVNSLLSPYWVPNQATSRWSRCWERQPLREHL
jgi:hypothetical protein